jgi:hypothetical protein
MQRKETIITIAIITLMTYTLALSLVGQAFPAQQTTKTLSSTGTIQTTAGVGVYSDSQCNTPLTGIPWGILEPGANQNFVCYIKNEGNIPSTLSMYTANWNPSAAPNYITLSWDYNGQAVNPGDVIQVTFTLDVDVSISGIASFSFDITIVGSS